MPPAAELNPAPLARAIEAWFRLARRELPWRPASLDQPRDPYHCLVSELMLQQTQVSRVRERYARFIERFPTPHALARADEAEVLALWSGLGYYRRARLLHSAAKAIVDNHGGRFPSEPDQIRALPGVGRYTAGSIASLAFGARAPIVDGNVARVLLRVCADDAPPAQTRTQKRLWSQARALVDAAACPGVLNEGLMELGATVCTPRSPSCDTCPLRAMCASSAQGRQHEIPTPKPAATQKPLYCDAVRIRDARGRYLIERRPREGLWGGLHQAPTLESGSRHARRAELLAWIGATELTPGERFTHQTTHRRVSFRVWQCAPVRGMKTGHRTWATRSRLRELALSSPQRRILGL